jgi:hypothetical protein
VYLCVSLTHAITPQYTTRPVIDPLDNDQRMRRHTSKSSSPGSAAARPDTRAEKGEHHDDADVSPNVGDDTQPLASKNAVPSASPNSDDNHSLPDHNPLSHYVLNDHSLPAESFLNQLSAEQAPDTADPPIKKVSQMNALRTAKKKKPRTTPANWNRMR